MMFYTKVMKTLPLNVIEDCVLARSYTYYATCFKASQRIKEKKLYSWRRTQKCFSNLRLTEKFLGLLQNLANVPSAIENSNLQVSSEDYGGKWYYLYRIISEVKNETHNDLVPSYMLHEDISLSSQLWCRLVSYSM